MAQQDVVMAGCDLIAAERRGWKAQRDAAEAGEGRPMDAEV